MDSFEIIGGNKLEGSIIVESAKNSVLPIIASTVMIKGDVVIKNCPKISDVLAMIEIIKKLGGKAYFENNNLICNTDNLNKFSIPKNLSKKMRSSVFLLGALLSRFKKAEMYLPGGCKIGKRPIDIHIDALNLTGYSAVCDGNVVICKKISDCDSNYNFLQTSVGATENLILSSVLKRSITKIYNGAKEPEIEDLCNFLNLCGAKIFFDEGYYEIEGVKKLNGVVYKPISDRIETGTYLLLSVITGGNIEILNANSKNIFSIVNKIANNTCKITINNDIINIKGKVLKKAFNLETNPYPNFPTDMQAQMMTLATISNGVSIITENVFEDRFKHVKELIKLGANIEICGNSAIIRGVKKLHGANVMADDLRGGASLVLAGLVCSGKTTIYGIHHIDRGYLNLEQKLANLGAKIKRIKG